MVARMLTSTTTVFSNFLHEPLKTAVWKTPAFMCAIAHRQMAARLELITIRYTVHKMETSIILRDFHLQRCRKMPTKIVGPLSQLQLVWPQLKMVKILARLFDTLAPVIGRSTCPTTEKQTTQ